MFLNIKHIIFELFLKTYMHVCYALLLRLCQYYWTKSFENINRIEVLSQNVYVISFFILSAFKDVKKYTSTKESKLIRKISVVNTLRLVGFGRWCGLKTPHHWLGHLLIVLLLMFSWIEVTIYIDGWIEREAKWKFSHNWRCWTYPAI